MQALFLQDPASAASRLRCRPSYHGGRTIATPAATPTQTSAHRRRGGKARSAADCIAEIVPRGDLGRDDFLVLEKLMNHATTNAGLAFSKAADPGHPRAGEYTYVPVRAAASPSGSLRVLGRSQDEIRNLYAALHGRTILVGQEHVVLEVRNDYLEIQRQQGNDPRVRP